MVASIFGMNLDSRLEGNNLAFILVTIFTVTLAILVIVLFMLFAYQRGLLGMGVRRQNRDVLYDLARQVGRPVRPMEEALPQPRL